MRSQQRHNDHELIVSIGPRILPVVLCMQKSVISTRITCLYWSQTFICGFVHSKQRLISIRITSLNWFQAPSFVAFACKTAPLGPELQVYIGLQSSPMVLSIQNSAFSTRIASLYGSQPSSVVLCIHNSDFSIRNTSLYGSQPSSVVLWMQNNVISIRITSIYGSKPPHLWLLYAKQQL